MYKFSTERRQENSSFASWSVGLCVGACKCAVLCIGYSLFGFYSLSFSSKLSTRFSVFLHLAVTVACMKRWGLRAAILSSYTELDAG